ncbi:type II toxin-antitoxin system RelE/ParE family toxin [uncultured Treponema sp.]|uniref:type II toxin-antitoxin system RelE family toxin n=1 Tax=uncultured Treponema sp. TaxID=162155 RepID=UPI00259A5625|nr:type II toxin-antitoxin system RelE/ParE family toxin [uncultured Treponema sp.]
MTLIYSDLALKQLKKMDKPVSKRIVDYMDDVARLENPRERGKMLVGNLLGFWRYRVGDYRVLCKIRDQELIISVVDVGHRKEVYDS